MQKSLRHNTRNYIIRGFERSDLRIHYGGI